MQKFLEICAQIGVDKISDRASKLEASIPGMCSDSVLFFICGHDYIFNSNDNKFQGIVNLFILESGEFEVNIYPECRQAVLALLRNPAVKVSLETVGTGTAGAIPFVYDAAQAKKAGGVQAGGAANYNLQTKALELIVTHPKGADFQGTITREIIPKFNAFYAKRGPVSELTRETLNNMRTALTRYWGGDVRNLGL